MNLYEVLGVSNTATEAEIKTAYRKKARVMHPDKGGDKGGFQELEEAYRILMDSVKRKKYDETGSIAKDYTIEEEAFQEFIQLLNLAVDKFIAEELRKKDIFQEMRQQINEALATRNKNIRDIPLEIEKLKLCKNNIKKDHNGIFANAFDKKIERLVKTKEMEEKAVQVLNHMFEHFEKFKYEFQRDIGDQVNYIRYSPFSNYSTTAGNWY